MRSYSSGFFETARLGKELLDRCTPKKQRLIDALLIILTVATIALEMASEITGISLLNFCAEIMEGLHDFAQKKLSP